MKKIAYLFVLSIVMLVGCGDDTKSAQKEKSKQKSENLLQGQLDAMNKAKNVEKVLQEAQKKRDEQLKKQENGG